MLNYKGIKALEIGLRVRGLCSLYKVIDSDLIVTIVHTKNASKRQSFLPEI